MIRVWLTMLMGVAVFGGAVAPSRAAEPQAESSDAASEEAAEAALRKKYRKSKLTTDVSERTADHRYLLLSNGEDKTVDIDFETNKDLIYVAKPNIVQPTHVLVGGKQQIVFRPTAPGDSSVMVRDPDGILKIVFHVRVSPSNLLRMANELRSLLRDVEGISIRIVGAKVVVEGETLVPADYARVLGVIMQGSSGDKADYSKHVLNLMSLSPLAMQMLAKKMQDDINVFAPNVKTRVVNGRIFLEGTVDNLDVARRAAMIATLYLPDPRPLDPLTKLDPDGSKKLEGNEGKLIQNFILVNPPPPKKAEKLVRVTVHFVELSKDYNKLFGFQWRPGFTSGSDQLTIGAGQAGGVAGGGASFSATISSLFPKLKSAQDAGYARVLNTGTFIVRSGQPALLKQGTEYPYLMQSGPQGAQTGKSFAGLEVAATPLILGQSEDIQMELNLYQTEMVSRGGASTGGVPTMANHTIKTFIYVKSNESAAVAAVNSSRVGTLFNKDAPETGAFSQGTEELFNLTRSKAYRKSKTQFVIFVTPQIIDNASDGTEDLRKNFRVKVK